MKTRIYTEKELREMLELQKNLLTLNETTSRINKRINDRKNKELEVEEFETHRCKCVVIEKK